MTEGPPTRTKRMGARFFKNPPQPHMCIQDYLKESWTACYINVLSWDKIEMAHCPSDRLPFYGGMKINPPRTENPLSAVFFVMANPEILRRNGKKAQDPKEQSSLIELLIDFVEAMNEGVVFERKYKILDDRDITGELKEIWSVVQSDRAKAQDTLGCEDVIRPVPQYPQYQDQPQNQQKHQLHQQQHQQHQQHQQLQQHQLHQQHQQQQQKSHHQQLPQQYRQPSPQQHQHQLHQMQTQQPQPPQYHFDYSMPNRRLVEKCDNYDLGYARRLQIANNTQHDRMYQSRRDRLYDYQYQQPTGPPRPMGPQYPTANCHPNANLGCSNMGNLGVRPVYHITHALENNVFVKLHRMEQPQQPQLQLAHAPQVQRYEPIDVFYKQKALNAHMGMMGVYGPQTSTPIKHPPNKRQGNSATHVDCSTSPVVKENSGKSKSPVKVLQRDSSIISADGNHISEETIRSSMTETKNVQVTDLDEDEPKGQNGNKSDQSMTTERSEATGKLTPKLPLEVLQVNNENGTNSPQHLTSVHKPSNSWSVKPPGRFNNDSNHKKQVKIRIMALRRDNSGNNGNMARTEDGRFVKNGAPSGFESQQNNGVKEKTVDCEQSGSDGPNGSISEAEVNGYIDETQKVPHERKSCTKGTESRNLELLESPVNESNGRLYNESKKNVEENDSSNRQVYTILRKSNSTSPHEDLTNEITQLSIKECTDSNDVGAVHS